MTKKLLLLTMTLCLLSAQLSAQKIDDEMLDHLFAEWDKPDTPGAAVGVFKDGEIVFAKGYGMANLEYDIPNTPNSVFRIASTSKQFTAACIVLLAEQGKLQLTDKLADFFPDFPPYAKDITVWHLLNHTSGIRDYLAVASLKGLRDDDYYEDEDIMRWLVRQQEPNFPAGAEFLYSNSGYWLLGQIVNQVAGMNMADFAQQEIFEPLGMSSTHFHNDHNAIVKNRASGYYPSGEDEYQISMTTLNMIGDGGIFTTINDIKKWDDAYYQSEVLSPAFWATMTQKGTLSNGDPIDYAAGLFLEDYRGLPTISHGGAFVGFRAELIRFPEQKMSIAIFANRGDANPSRLAYQIADILLEDQLEDEVESSDDGPLDLPDDSAEFTLEQVVGAYEIIPGVSLEISLEDDSLRVHQLWNGERYAIARVNHNTFQVPGDTSMDFIFTDLQDGFTQQVIVVQGNRKTVCDRNTPFDTSTVDLSAYTGTYYSSEIDIHYHIKQVDEGLELTMGKNPPRPLLFRAADELMFGSRSMSFETSDTGFSGFTLQAGRVQNLWFEKQ